MKNVFRKVANRVNEERNLKVHRLTSQAVADIVTGISYTPSHPVHQHVKIVFKELCHPKKSSKSSGPATQDKS